MRTDEIILAVDGGDDRPHRSSGAGQACRAPAGPGRSERSERVGATAGQGVVWYTGQFYALTFMESVPAFAYVPIYMATKHFSNSNGLPPQIRTRPTWS